MLNVMQEYKVYTAGCPGEIVTIRAFTSLEAACIYFKDHMFRNGVVVESGRFTSETFLWSDLKKEFPPVEENQLEYKKREEKQNHKIPWWKDFLLRLFMGNNYYR